LSDDALPSLDLTSFEGVNAGIAEGPDSNESDNGSENAETDDENKSEPESKKIEEQKQQQEQKVEQQKVEQQKTVASTNSAVFGVGVPVALGAAAIGLFMLRKGRSIAKDIKFAFGPAEQAGGNNPLYESLIKTEDNPLYVNMGVKGSRVLGVRNIDDAV
jgi:hypothetical protein